MKNIALMVVLITGLDSFAGTIKRSYPDNPVESMLPMENGEVPSAYHFFDDNEIIKVHDYHSGDCKYPTKNDKRRYIYQQPSKVSCAYSCVDMIMSDYLGFPIGITDGPGSAYIDDIVQLLEDRGMNVAKYNVAKEDGLKSLKELIDTHSSVIYLTSDDTFNGHYIIIDEIADDLTSVRIRDPWHGWDISVYGRSFKQRISGYPALYIESMKTKDIHFEDEGSKSFWKKIFSRKKKSNYIDGLLSNIENGC